MRGTANNEPVVSQASTPEFRAGHARVFGDKPVQRGMWVWDEAQGKLVDAASYVPPSEAKDAPILSGRFYEDAGPSPVDGSEINSRRKHREHMRRHGLAMAGDFEQSWSKAEARRERIRAGEPMKIPGLRDAIGRKLYEIDKP